MGQAESKLKSSWDEIRSRIPPEWRLAYRAIGSSAQASGPTCRCRCRCRNYSICRSSSAPPSLSHGSSGSRVRSPSVDTREKQIRKQIVPNRESLGEPSNLPQIRKPRGESSRPVNTVAACEPSRPQSSHQSIPPIKTLSTCGSTPPRSDATLEDQPPPESSDPACLPSPPPVSPDTTSKDLPVSHKATPVPPSSPVSSDSSSVSSPPPENDVAGESPEPAVATAEGPAADNTLNGGKQPRVKGKFNVDPDSDFVKSRAEEKQKKGSKGNPVDLQANHYVLKTPPNWVLYEYSVHFDKEDDRVSFKKWLLRLAADELQLGYVFDGDSLFTSRPLTKVLIGHLDVDIALKVGETRKDSERKIPGNLRFSSHESTEGNTLVIQISIAYPEPEKKVDATITVKCVKVVAPDSPIYAQFYNVLLRRCLHAMNLQSIDRIFYNFAEAIQLPEHRLELVPGFVTTLRLHENQILLSVDQTYKIVWTETVLDVSKQLTKQNWTGTFKNVIVMTTYNRKTYRVTDFNFTLNPQSTFDHKGKTVTFVDYYRTKHGVEIKDMNQPLLVSRFMRTDPNTGDKVQAEVMLIPELCRPTGLTEAHRNKFILMKDLAAKFNMTPAVRKAVNDGFMNNFLSNPEIQGELSKWRLGFEKEGVNVTARILPKEAILFSNDSFVVGETGEFHMAFRNQKMISAVALSKWSILVPEVDSDLVDQLVKTMSKMAAPLSMKIYNPKQVVKIKFPSKQAYMKILNKMVHDHQDSQIFFVILPNSKPDLYSAVKKKLTVDVGIPSQCFQARNLKSKGLLSIATKVVIQMNAKLGGEPWTVKLPSKNTMFIGFGVFHGIKGVGAMVATISANFARYFSTTSNFNDGDKLQRNICSDVIRCIKCYQAQNGNLPERIIFYRDGVGQDELGTVYTVELPRLLDDLAKFYRGESEKPKLTYIVVNKKMHTRFFQMKENVSHNPPPGTVADDVVTFPERYDFYLMSCGARQGTVSPCYFNVLHDESGWEPDRIQLVTYKMCHMHFNWFGISAVPAPCQYANKLAFLTATVYKGRAKDKLNKVLHFL